MGADVLYVRGGHGAEAAYIIETESAGESADGEEVVFEDMLAAADPEKGARVFRKCTACHKLEDGANGTGPYLYAIVDRPVASAKGFTGYSAAMQAHGGNWTPEALDAFLSTPKLLYLGHVHELCGPEKAAGTGRSDCLSADHRQLIIPLRTEDFKAAAPCSGFIFS